MTCAELEFQIEQLKPRVRAEALLAAADPSAPNPWKGSALELDDAKRKLEEANVALEAEKFTTAFTMYRRALEGFADAKARAKLQTMDEELRSFNPDLLQNWNRIKRASPPLANIVEGKNTVPCIPDEKIAEAFEARTEQIIALRKYFALENARRELAGKLDSYGVVIQDLENRYPVFRDIQNK